MAETLTVRCRQYAGKYLVACPVLSFFFPSPLEAAIAEALYTSYLEEVLWKAGISHSGKGLVLTISGIRTVFIA